MRRKRRRGPEMTLPVMTSGIELVRKHDAKRSP